VQANNEDDKEEKEDDQEEKDGGDERKEEKEEKKQYEATVMSLVWNLLDKNVKHFETQHSMTDTLRIIRVGLQPYLNSMSGFDHMPSSYRTARRRIEHAITHAKRYTSCTLGCTLYYGDRAAVDECPVCNEPRSKATKSFFYFSIIDKLKDAFADPLLSEQMRHGFEWGRAAAVRAAKHAVKVADAKATGQPEPKPDPAMCSDVFDGLAWKNIFLPKMGGGDDPVNVALRITVDGVEVCQRPKHTIWPILVVVQNYPSNVRSKASAGPKVADLNQFLGAISYHHDIS